MEGQLLYGRAHCADCELRLVSHDVSGLDVPVVHGVLERRTSVGVFVAHVAIERDFGSSPVMRRVTPVTDTTITQGSVIFWCWFFFKITVKVTVILLIDISVKLCLIGKELR